jgi:aldehyde ferredoxin oxidoreductase-like protein
LMEPTSMPPPTLDGARVLWWACAGEVPFGELPGAEGEDRLIYGFAVCRYDSGEIYRFTCAKDWHVVQDSGPAKGVTVRLGKMLPVSYRSLSWDEQGVPTREKLVELGSV